MPAPAFLAVELVIGARVLGLRAAATAAFDGNRKALAARGISKRGVAVLRWIAPGHSDKPALR